MEMWARKMIMLVTSVAKMVAMTLFAVWAVGMVVLLAGTHQFAIGWG